MSDLTTVKRQYNEAIGALWEQDKRIKQLRAIAEPQVKAARERQAKRESCEVIGCGCEDKYALERDGDQIVCQGCNASGPELYDSDSPHHSKDVISAWNALRSDAESDSGWIQIGDLLGIGGGDE